MTAVTTGAPGPGLHGGPDRLWNGPYIFLLVLSAISSTAFNMVTPTLPRYAVSLGAGLTIAGTLSGIFALTALAVRPFSGLAVDRLNKKRLLVGATAVMAVAVTGYTLSASLPVLFAFRILHGAAFAFSGTANTSMAIAYIPRNRLGEGVGYLGLGFILATAIGPSIGLSLGARYGYPVSFAVSAAMFALTTALMTLIRYQPPERTAPADGAPMRARSRLHLRDLFATELIVFAVLAGLLSVSNGITATFVSLLADERGIPNIGLFFTVSAAFLLMVRLTAGRVVDRRGLGVVLYPSIAITAVSLLVIGGARTLPVILLGSAMRSLGQGAAQPALQATCIRRLGPLRTGVATSTFFVGADVGQGLGPIVGGAISDVWGYSAMYGSAAALLLSGMAVFRLYTRREARRLAAGGPVSAPQP